MAKRLFYFLKSISLYFQKTPGVGRCYGLKFNWDGRRMFFFYDYEWHNLSETHRSENCDDPAYCQWHGSL
jgi:hypothetical protein